MLFASSSANQLCRQNHSYTCPPRRPYMTCLRNHSVPISKKCFSATNASLSLRGRSFWRSSTWPTTMNQRGKCHRIPPNLKQVASQRPHDTASIGQSLMVIPHHQTSRTCHPSQVALVSTSGGSLPSMHPLIFPRKGYAISIMILKSA